jgi:hypothetical protein
MYGTSVKRTGWPDWADFRSPIGWVFSFGHFLKNKPTFLGCFVTRLVLCIDTRKMGWAKLWAIFPQTHLVTLKTKSADAPLSSAFDMQVRRNTK